MQQRAGAPFQPFKPFLTGFDDDDFFDGFLRGLSGDGRHFDRGRFARFDRAREVGVLSPDSPRSLRLDRFLQRRSPPPAR